MTRLGSRKQHRLQILIGKRKIDAAPETKEKQFVAFKPGAATLSIMTFSGKTLSITIRRNLTLSITKFSLKTISITIRRD
jgi:hypothetical protein